MSDTNTTEQTAVSEEDVEKVAGRTTTTDGGKDAWMTVAGSYV